MDISLRKFYKTIIIKRKVLVENERLKSKLSIENLFRFHSCPISNSHQMKIWKRGTETGAPTEKRTKENKKTIQCGNSHVHQTAFNTLHSTLPPPLQETEEKREKERNDRMFSVVSQNLETLAEVTTKQPKQEIDFRSMVVCWSADRWRLSRGKTRAFGIFGARGVGIVFGSWELHGAGLAGSHVQRPVAMLGMLGAFYLWIILGEGAWVSIFIWRRYLQLSFVLRGLKNIN